MDQRLKNRIPAFLHIHSQPQPPNDDIITGKKNIEIGEPFPHFMLEGHNPVQYDDPGRFDMTGPLMIAVLMVVDRHVY